MTRSISLAPLRALMVMIIVPGLAMAQDNTDTYPITIKHALGSTVIDGKPQRVATVAWANHEVPLALGVVPVGFAAATFGDDDGDGLLPWVRERLEELDADIPVLFNEGDGIDFEAVAATEPDVILAAYSGLSQSDYDTLSMIAPVVAYPDGPWSTDWRDMIRLNSAGLGMAAEGDRLIAEIEAEIEESVAKHPEINDKTAMFITHLDPGNLSTVSFYSGNDTRVKFFKDLGMHSPESVIGATNPGQFSGQVSAEEIDRFSDVDIFVTYGGEELLAPLQADPLTSHMPAISRGSVVMLGMNPIGTAANPTPLSISWVLDDYLDLLGDAARKAE